ncbi:MAG: NUDIX hydrolase [Candidatus Aenigmatarchaeota archaeon]
MTDADFRVGIKALVVNEKNEILLLNSGPAEERHSKIRFWDLPGGRIKDGSSIGRTLLREVEEELGVSEKSLAIGEIFDATISKFSAIRDQNIYLMLIVYKCKLVGNEKFKLSDEHSEWRWVSIVEAKELLSTKYMKDFTDKLDEL